jgi:hypothetical protein
MSDELDDDAARRDSADLRALWNALPRPSSGTSPDGLPSLDLSGSDGATRAAVEHLRAAWAAHAVDVPELPFALRAANVQRLARTAPRSRRAPSARALRTLVLAGAAAAALALVALRVTGEGPAGEPDRAVADAVTVDVSEPREVPQSAMPLSSVATLVEIPREDFALRADGIEFEAHGVRFVLIENTGAAQGSASGKKD